VIILFWQYSLGENCDAYALSGFSNCSTSETIGRNMPNTNYHYSDLGARFSSQSASLSTSDSSLHLCSSMDNRPAGFLGRHGAGSLDLHGQDLSSCTPRSLHMLHGNGSGGFGGQLGKGVSAGYPSHHRFEAMKARSFVEEAQSTVIGIPVSNSSFVCDMMAQTYQSFAPRLRKECRSTDNAFTGMPTSEPSPNVFLSDQPSCCAMLNQGLSRSSECSTDFLSAEFPSSNRGTLSHIASCNQNMFDTAFASSQQGKQMDKLPNESRLDMNGLPARASAFVTDASAFHNSTFCRSTPASSFGDSLSGDIGSCAKRLSRTDSHERLSNISAERSNAENLFYCKGRRWGG
jgi:hypothetical protein